MGAKKEHILIVCFVILATGIMLHYKLTKCVAFRKGFKVRQLQCPGIRNQADKTSPVY